MDEISLVEVGKLSVDFDKVLSASSEDVFDEFMLTVDFNELSNEIGLSAANLNNKIVTQNDISSLVGAMHFRGVVERQEEETDYEALQRAIYDPQPGDIAIMQDNYKEYVYDGTNWIELGDEALYATKAEVSAGFLNLSNDYVQKISDLSDETHSLIDLVSTETLVSANYYVDNEISSLSNEIDFLVNDISSSLSNDYVERIDYLEDSIESLVNDISSSLSDDYCNKINDLETSINETINDISSSLSDDYVEKIDELSVSTKKLVADVSAETYTSATIDANSYTNEQIESLSINDYALSNDVTNGFLRKGSIAFDPNSTELSIEDNSYVLSNILSNGGGSSGSIVSYSSDSTTLCIDGNSYVLSDDLSVIASSISSSLSDYQLKLSDLQMSAIDSVVDERTTYVEYQGGAISSFNIVDDLLSDSIPDIQFATEVKIGTSVTNIEENAFYNAMWLSNIVIPNSVINIGIRAFNYCRKLLNIVIPNSITDIKTGTFGSCEKLSNVVIPNSVLSIGQNAFGGCNNLSNIIIPNSVTNIENGLFFYCQSLTNVMIPDRVTSIGDLAFYGCSSLMSVTIPNSVTSIGTDAFQFCDQNLSITFKNYYDKPLPSGFPWGMPTAISATWNDASQEWVNDQGFAKDGITLSDVQATIFDFGNGDLSSFSWKGELSQQDLNDAGIKDRDAVVKNPIAVRIGNSITSIGSDVFEDCSILTCVIIPNSVLSIGGDAFFQCVGLTSITIPNSITSIGDYAFSDCTNLSEIMVEGKTQAQAEMLLVNANVPTDCQIKTWNFEPKPAYIAPVFEQTFTNINLAGRKLYYPAICQDEMYGTNSIVWRIMFLNEKNLTADKTLKVSDAGMATSLSVSFRPTEPYTTVDWMENGDGSVNGYLSVQNITTDIDVILRGYIGGYPDIKPYTYYNYAGQVNWDLYKNAKSIGSYAFTGCSGLTSVIIPNSVMSIGNDAFFACSKLTSVMIPNSVTSIGDSAFNGCDSLSSMTIPNSVMSIGKNAFYYCRGLSSVTIGNGVTSIGAFAFQSCFVLTKVMFEGNAPNIIGNSIFNSVATGCTAYVHRDSSGWGVTIPGTWQGINIAYIEDQTT